MQDDVSARAVSLLQSVLFSRGAAGLYGGPHLGAGGKYGHVKEETRGNVSHSLGRSCTVFDDSDAVSTGEDGRCGNGAERRGIAGLAEAFRGGWVVRPRGLASPFSQQEILDGIRREISDGP